MGCGFFGTAVIAVIALFVMKFLVDIVPSCGWSCRVGTGGLRESSSGYLKDVDVSLGSLLCFLRKSFGSLIGTLAGP